MPWTTWIILLIALIGLAAILHFFGQDGMK